VPSPTNVAYTLSQVLHSRRVDLADVRSTIGELEPLCAALCARRADRAATVLPALDEAQERLRSSLERGEGSAAAVAARDWHEALVRLCGSATLAVVAGALEDVWSSHIREGLLVTEARGWAPDPALSASVVDDHARINELIRAGDADGARQMAAAHLHGRPRIHAEGGDVAQRDVRAGVVREQLFKR
jgi:DNA-binding FadR family transcriptional regulator